MGAEWGRLTMATIEVRAHRGQSSAFTITAGGTRKEIEDAIAERLRSDAELVWEDDPEGINVACISGNNIWRPRRRFSMTGDENNQLLIENKSGPTPDDGE
jgi:hypothetical protein